MVKGIILHGGHGTRLRPLTHTGPKQLIPIANKPISQYVIEDLAASGVNEVAIILGDIYPEKVKEYYGDGSRFGIEISYIQQSKPLGIAHAISLCEDFIEDDKFLVYLGDNLLKGGVKNYLEKFTSSNMDAMILLTKVDDPTKFGVAEFDLEGRLLRLIEKPKQPPSNYALTGIYFLSPKIFKIIEELKPSWRGELEITEVLQTLISKDYNIVYEFVSGWWKDTGTTEDILEANRLVLDELKPKIKGTVENNSSIQGRVQVNEGAIIKKGASITGPSVIGEDTIIESNVYIHSYTSIGNDVIIKRGELENSIIMDGCLIDVEERIIDSLIGPHCHIESGKTKKPKGRKFTLGERSEIFL